MSLQGSGESKPEFGRTRLSGSRTLKTGDTVAGEQGGQDRACSERGNRSWIVAGSSGHQTDLGIHSE